jgi:hypothetical protein
MQENTETTTETTATEATQEAETSPNNNYTGPMSNKMRKLIKKQQQMMKANYQNYLVQLESMRKKEEAKFKQLKDTVGKSTYKALRKACTETVPEVKAEDGTVTTPAKQVVNKGKFLRELSLAVIVLREDRILKGKRKRTTGRSSRRKSHRESLKAILARFEEIKQNETITPIEGAQDAVSTNDVGTESNS